MPNSTRRIPRCPEFNSTYPGGCRCRFCTNTNTRRRTEERLRYLNRERGGQYPTDRLPVEPSRDLVRRAFENGATDRELERLTGLRRLAISKIRLGRTKFVTRDTHDRIRRALDDNTDVRSFSKYTRVPLGWTRAMIYGLCAQGWSITHQRELLQSNLGVKAGFIQAATCGKYTHVYYSNEQALRWLVSEIGDARGPSTRTAKWAARNGYFPTKHYDSRGELVVSSLPKEMRQGIEGV